MGMMNVGFFHERNAEKVQNFAEEVYIQSCDRCEMSMPFSDGLFGVPGMARKRHQSARAEDGTLSGHVFAPQCWHTSAKGTIILTTDYLINLSMVNPDFSLESDANFVKDLAAQYRKELKFARSHFKARPELEQFVTGKTYIKQNPSAQESLPEICEPDADAGHLVMLNYDHLRESEAVDIKKSVNDLHETMKVAGHNCYTDGRRTNHYDHWCTIPQDVVVVIRYDHLTMQSTRVLGRNRRTPPTELARRINEFAVNGALPIYASEYLLAREFFASQGIEVNL